MPRQSLLAVSPEPPASMEDTHLQSDKGISTDKIQMSSTDEERSKDTFGDNSKSLTTHQIPKEGDKRFSCIQCDKVFCKSSCLKKHKLVHTGAKQFTCIQYGKTFCRSGTLKTHKLSQTGEKEFTCSQCDKVFSEPATLKTHKLSQTDKKEFVCTQCGRTFSQSGVLNRHKLCHTGVKKFFLHPVRQGFLSVKWPEETQALAYRRERVCLHPV